MIANKLMLATLLFFVCTCMTYAQDDIFKYDMSLAMDRGDAKKALENAGFEIENDTRVSKKLRSFFVAGSIYSSISDPHDTDKSTELDFYDNRLMNTTLTVKSKDYIANTGYTNTFLSELTKIYGKHSAYEKVMSIKSWMWMAGNTKILLNSDSRKKTAKISFIYLPLYSKKYEDNVKVKLKGKPFDPVDDMILK
ncbi:MAG TPA: hypothetical protein VLB82_04875 [Thermodesulfobacteriota bacterium]|nr:hypothetical protein [Thermodesulfobacteriota bacterium]